ncbi:MAG: UvrD-helicase domain-containing protein, partial [Terriglobia bacterium]
MPHDTPTVGDPGMSRSLMSPQPPFDYLRCSLSGRQLIESSAGTGKTYAITCLFLRLLLERGFSVKDILVVTFTEAATAELKLRIREKIGEAISLLEGGSTMDSFLSGLLPTLENRSKAHLQLVNGLRTFDESAIDTIHGFCQQVLRNHAFESGSSFDAELIPNQNYLL